MRGARSLTGLILCAGAAAVAAATPDEWERHREEVVVACTKASGLRNPKPVGELVIYSDQVGYDALLMSGTHPEPHMKSKKTQVLCLFNRSTRWAYATDAEFLTKRQPRPRNQTPR